jgi:hypothetical protein
LSERTPDQNAISAAHNLTGALKGMQGELARLNRFGRRNRHLIWLTFASIGLDVALTILLVFAYGTARNSQVEAHAARAVAASEHQSLLYACKLGNQSRAQQVQLWDHLVGIAQAPPRETTAQRKARLRTIRSFLGYVRRSFAPRPCRIIYKLPGGRP